MRTCTIPDYDTEEFREALEWWGLQKRYGWPWSGGWAEQPARIVDYVRALDEAEAIRDAEERELHGG